jgi:hypothetical protein
MVGKKSLISGKIVYLLSHKKPRFVDEMEVFAIFFGVMLGYSYLCNDYLTIHA